MPWIGTLADLQSDRFVAGGLKCTGPELANRIEWIAFRRFMWTIQRDAGSLKDGRRINLVVLSERVCEENCGGSQRGRFIQHDEGY